MKRLRVLLLLLTTVVPTIPGAQAQQIGEVPKVDPGQAEGGEVLAWTSPAGQPYWYRLPRKIQEKSPPNLIFMLHGSNVPYGWAFWNYPIGNGGFRPDDIVVAPEGMAPAQGDGVFNFIQGKPDGDQLRDLIQAFDDEFPIGNVYLYGHSQGAFFAYWFAGEYPELVDGIVAHAGNVLDVRHTTLSKEKVAIGILHADSDQVVPVECAHRTDKIYRELGYQKVRLYIIEGIRPQAGHWPMPSQVLEMLEWLDQVSVSSARQGVSVALSELGKEWPDLGVISDAVREAEGRIKKYRGDDADEVRERLSLIRAWLDGAAQAHAELLNSYPDADDIKEKMGDWASHFSSCHRAFAENKEWERAVREMVALAKKHEKVVGKALKGLSKPGRSSFRAALDALEEGYMSSDWRKLESAVLALIEDPPKGVKAEDLQRAKGITEAGRGYFDAGVQAQRECTAELAGAFRKSHPELFGAVLDGR